MSKRLLAAVVFVGGCYTGDLDPMEQQPKLEEYEATRHFDDERAMRSLVEGTVPRERDLDGAPKITAELLQLGQEKYNQMCTPCHGFVGDGKGSVAHKMSLRQPPSLHDARRRGLTSEWMYRAITEGYGLMPRFTTQLDAHERWAVVAYVRVLQRSQDVAYDRLTPELREELDHPRPKAAPAPVPGHGGHGAPAHSGPPTGNHTNEGHH
jgi:mono/diheme cytochrome c family protein